MKYKGYKINTKIRNFLYTNKQQVEKEIRKPIPFSIASNNTQA
jgi:hypothetical protein